MYNSNLLVFNRNDKNNKQLTVLSHLKLALIGRNILMAITFRETATKYEKQARRFLSYPARETVPLVLVVYSPNAINVIDTNTIVSRALK
jgi:hypothetical protein